MMTRSELFALTAALTASMTGQVAAQSVSTTVRPESKVMLAGSSNVHDWACSSSAFQATIELDTAFQTRPMFELATPIKTVAVTIPVRSLKCGHGKMDDNMYKALGADRFPDIRYVLESYELDAGLTTLDGFAAKTFGHLTVAGKTVRVEIPITAIRNQGGSMTGEGSLRMKMTEFGIKPPVALLGTLRTKDEIEISFSVLLDKTVIVALQQQP
jgi:polyisoprenoid-binding protein YceI